MHCGTAASLFRRRRRTSASYFDAVSGSRPSRQKTTVRTAGANDLRSKRPPDTKADDLAPCAGGVITAKGRTQAQASIPGTAAKATFFALATGHSRTVLW